MITYKSSDDAYWTDLRYFSNALGELHNRGTDITNDELPSELAFLYSNFYEVDQDGNDIYLAKYEDTYGIAIQRTFYEEKDGQKEEVNNRQHAYLAAKMIETAIFQGVVTHSRNSYLGDITTVIIGNIKEGTHESTELTVFFKYDSAMEQSLSAYKIEYNELSRFISSCAYMQKANEDIFPLIVAYVKSIEEKEECPWFDGKLFINTSGDDALDVEPTKGTISYGTLYDLSDIEVILEELGLKMLVLGSSSKVNELYLTESEDDCTVFCSIDL